MNVIPGDEFVVRDDTCDFGYNVQCIILVYDFD